jgi:hypothetical protein
MEGTLPFSIWIPPCAPELFHIWTPSVIWVPQLNYTRSYVSYSSSSLVVIYSRIRTIWGFHNKSNLELLCCHSSSASLPTWSLYVIFALFNKNPMQAMSKRVLNPGKKKTQNLWPKSPDQPLLCLSSPVNESFAAFHHTQQEWGVHTITNLNIRRWRYKTFTFNP